jgi:hypothetical protein
MLYHAQDTSATFAIEIAPLSQARKKPRATCVARGKINAMLTYAVPNVTPHCFNR